MFEADDAVFLCHDLMTACVPHDQPVVKLQNTIRLLMRW